MNFLKDQGTPIVLFQEHLLKSNSKFLSNHVKKKAPEKFLPFSLEKRFSGAPFLCWAPLHFGQNFRSREYPT